MALAAASVATYIWASGIRLVILPAEDPVSDVPGETVLEQAELIEPPQAEPQPQGQSASEEPISDDTDEIPSPEDLKVLEEMAEQVDTEG
jgi:hypothetical protein